MATTIVYKTLDVSATGSISTIVSTAGTFAGSLSASALTITGTATFSGTAVFVGTAQFLATVTFSATVAFLTSVQISGTLSVATLVVSGTASFSATVAFTNATVTTLGVTSTASFAAQANFAASVSISAFFSISGFVTGSCLLGSLSLLANSSIRFSGSWSDFSILELVILFKSSGASNTGSVALYTDGGTTAIVSLNTGTVSTAAFNYIEATIFNGGGFKGMKVENGSVATFTNNLTATANTAATLNCIQFNAGTSATLSSGHAMLYGRRR